MRRSLPMLVVALVSALTLSACGKSDYCQTVSDNTELLSKDNTDSNAAFLKWADVMETLGKQGPEDLRDDYTKVVAAARGVVKAQDEVGISLEEIQKDPKKAPHQDTPKGRILQEAYTEFNSGTDDQRAAILTNIKRECEITLK